MKQLSLSLTVIVMLVFQACTKDGIYSDKNDISGSTENSILKSLNCGEVFTVLPSGNDDTENLIEAFADAKAAGPGSVVKLVEGQYTTGRLDIHEFYGSFIGAGRNKTIITSAPDIICGYMVDNNVIPRLIEFTGGDFLIADMEIKISDGFACSDETAYGGHDMCMILALNDYGDLYRPDYKYIKAVVNNVAFKGGFDDGSGSVGGLNVAGAIWIGADWWWQIEGREYPLTKCNVTVSNCTFENFLISSESAYLGKDGLVTYSNNIMKNLYGGIFIAYNFGAKAIIKNNIFENNTGMDLWIDDDDWGGVPYVPLTVRSKYDVYGNVFKPAPGGTGIYMKDSRIIAYPENYLAQLLTINNNIFKLQDGSTGIFSWNNQDAIIKSNKFTGSATAGILLDGDVPSKNNLLMANNFSGAFFTDAAVVLGANSMNCTVIGSGNSTITNLGTGNKITGNLVKPGGRHMGPSIRYNLNQFKRSN